MDAMLHHGMTLRGNILEDAVDIIDKLTACTQIGIGHYIFENDLSRGVLSPSDMILWEDWNTTLKSRNFRQSLYIHC
jgi:hypothetical protein